MKALRQTLKTLKKINEKYLALLSETYRLAAQQYAGALEFKKRVGRKLIAGNEIPDGLADALKGTIMSRVEPETQEIINIQIFIEQQIECFRKPIENDLKIKDTLKKILRVMNKRIELLYEITKLENRFDRKKKTISETELKILEYESLRRMDSQDSMKEFFLGLFVPSESAKNLTELILSVYKEMIKLEYNLDNLKSRNQLTKNLIKLSEDIKYHISEIIPLIQEQEKYEKNEEDEKWAMMKAMLKPEKAEEIISDFKTKTGILLSKPANIDKKYLDREIQGAADILFEKYIQTAVTNQWIVTFRQRLSPKGINLEIAKYHDQVEILNSKALSIKHQIYKLQGRPQEDLEKLDPVEKPETKPELYLFLKGEIGQLRSDRNKIWSQKSVEVIIKLAGILFIAIFLQWLTGFVGEKIIKAYNLKNAENDFDEQTMGIIKLIRSIVKFIIMLLAVIATLYSLGFDVGAILAGLGIGGLAIAMAAKETIADVLGGFMIFVSNPFKVGDRIRIKGYDTATVKEIGIRTTKMEDFVYNTIHTVPNSIFSESAVENLSAWPGIMTYGKIRLSRKTKVKKLELSINIIKQVIEENKNTDPRTVKYNSFDDYSYVIRYWYNILNFAVRHQVMTDINIEIHKKFEENNIEFDYMPISTE